MNSASHFSFRKTPPTFLLPVGIGIFAFAVYLFTGSRTIQWQDHGQFAFRVGTGLLYNEWGLAMTHPLHFWLGRAFLPLFPGNAPWAVTAVSAAGGATAVALVFACVRRWTSRLVPALYAAGTLMLGHTFWRFSGLPEVKTLSAALLMAQVYCLLRMRQEGKSVWWLPLLGFNGLHWANHNLALLELAVLAPVFAVVWLRHKSLTHGQALAAMGLWIVGALPYLALILLTLFREREFWTVVQSALFGYGFKERALNVNPVLLYTLVTLAFTVFTFPGFALPLALRSAFRERRDLALPLAMLGMHLLFVLRYEVIDQYHFMVPSFALIAFFAGLGFDRLRSPLLRRAAFLLLLLQPLLYALAPTLARRATVIESLNFVRAKPYRDDAEYLLWPWTVQETSAARIAAEAADAAAPEGVIVVEDYMGIYAVQWTLHERGLGKVDLLRPDDHRQIEQAHQQSRPVIRMPARSDTPPPEGWRKQGELWVWARGHSARQ